MQPDTAIFWGNDSSGVNQRPGFWSTIASENVQVFREDTIEVKDGTIIMPADTVSPDMTICATGWQPSYHQFLDAELARNLGLAVPLSEDEGGPINVADAVKWAELEQAADDEVCKALSPTAEATATPQECPDSITVSSLQIHGSDQP